MQKGDIYKVEIPSSKQRAADFPFTFMIEPDEFNNLDVVSVALVFQLRAIEKMTGGSRIK